LGHILGHLGVSALPGQPTHQAAGVSPVEGFQSLLVPTLESLHQGIVRAQTTLIHIEYPVYVIILSFASINCTSSHLFHTM
jgi:hypothetical protein